VSVTKYLLKIRNVGQSGQLVKNDINLVKFTTKLKKFENFLLKSW